MQLAVHPVAAAAANYHPATRHWQQVVSFLNRRRIPITSAVFAALLIEDIVTGYKPHDVTNVRDLHTCLGWTLLLGGIALRSWAAGTLRKGIQLTTTGVYRLIRNPLYVGSFMIMIGFTILIDDPENIFVVLGPLLLLYVLKVRNEERMLAARYGVVWQNYARSTPRIFPRTISGRPFAGWTFSQWMTSREYNAPLASIAGLVGLRIWYLM